MTDTELDALARRVGEALAARGWRLASAESCTGGWIAEAVTAISGSSAWFDRGFVTYSNEAKMDMLQVDSNILETFGAVSIGRHSLTDSAISKPFVPNIRAAVHARGA